MYILIDNYDSFTHIIRHYIDKNNNTVEVIRNEDEFALIGEGFESGDKLLISRVSSLVNGLKVTLELR